MKIIKTTKDSGIPAAARSSVSAQRIIFVTGASRSGTTLLSFVLRRHEDVAGLPELQFFGEFCDPRSRPRSMTTVEATRIAARVFARQDQGVFSDRISLSNKAKAVEFVAGIGSKSRDALELFDALIGSLAAQQGKRIPCEQTPRNIFYAAPLLQAFPQARVIHLIRDPRAVLASQKMRWRRRQLAKNSANLPVWSPVRTWVNYHPYTITRLWNRASEAAARLANHDRVLLVKFEDLLNHPESTVRKICSHCGIDYQPQMLQIGQVNSSHQSARGDALQGFNVSAIDTWRNALSPAERIIVEKRCREGMQRFGYQPVSRSCEKEGFASAIRYKLSYLTHMVGVMALNPKRAWIQLQALRSTSDGGSKPQKQ